MTWKNVEFQSYFFPTIGYRLKSEWLSLIYYFSAVFFHSKTWVSHWQRWTIKCTIIIQHFRLFSSFFLFFITMKYIPFHTIYTKWNHERKIVLCILKSMQKKEWIENCLQFDNWKYNLIKELNRKISCISFAYISLFIF